MISHKKGVENRHRAAAQSAAPWDPGTAGELGNSAWDRRRGPPLNSFTRSRPSKHVARLFPMAGLTPQTVVVVDAVLALSEAQMAK